MLDIAAPDSWLEVLAEADDALAEAWLLEETVPHDDLVPAIGAQTRQGSVTPWLSGSALQGSGITELLDLIIGTFEQASPDPSGVAAGYVFKVEHDDRLGRIAHVRMYSGILKNRMAVPNSRTGSQFKAVQIRKYSGRKTMDVGVLEAGDIAAVAGLADVQAGDQLGETSLVPRAPEIAHALLRVHAEVSGPGDYKPLVAACKMLEAEEPKLKMIWEPSVRQLLLHVTGKIQTEILTEEFRQRFGLEVELTEPEVIYRETPAGTGEGFDAYTMPKPCWAVTRFRVVPLPPGSGVHYETVVPDTRISYRYQGQVEQTVPEVLAQGPRGWEVTDIAVTLIDGEDHPVHTHPLDFATVTRIALRKALFDSGTILLEPLWRFRLQVPEESIGKIIGEIINMRGSVDTSAMEEASGGQGTGRRLLTGTVPVATSLDLPVLVAQRTAGRGILNFSFAGYQPAPPLEEHTTPFRGIDPLDRDRYILHVRGALQ